MPVICVQPLYCPHCGILATLPTVAHTVDHVLPSTYGTCAEKDLHKLFIISARIVAIA